MKRVRQNSQLDRLHHTERYLHRPTIGSPDGDGEMLDHRPNRSSAITRAVLNIWNKQPILRLDSIMD
jgi:hypothetical protein